MQLITLNIWGGYLKEKLLNFFAKHQDIDIFCLQEVYRSASQKISTCDMVLSLDIFHDIAVCLPEHQGYFCEVVPTYGLAMFVKKSIKVIKTENVLIHPNNTYLGRGPTHQRLMQCLTYEDRDNQVTICNVHGLWNGKGKSDSSERIQQSKAIKDYANSLDNATILCGDFNLEPNTQSLDILKDNMTDLIADYSITSTRTAYYGKPIKYADYVLTTPDINTAKFKVLDDLVSDHAALWMQYCL